MNPGSTTYRFRAFERGGSLTFDGDAVRCEVREGFTRWEYTVPLGTLRPDPVRTWRTPAACWFCLLVGLAAGAAAAAPADLSGVPGDSWTLLARAAALGLGAVLLLFAARFRREEWVTFHPRRGGGPNVWYCRGGPDRRDFDAVTGALARGIREAAGMTPERE